MFDSRTHLHEHAVFQFVSWAEGLLDDHSSSRPALELALTDAVALRMQLSRRFRAGRVAAADPDPELLDVERLVERLRTTLDSRP